MADEQYLLEDLEDEGEEVDYDELTLDDEFLDEEIADGEEPTEDGKPRANREELNFDEPPPEFEEATLEGATAGTSELAHTATGAQAPAQENDLTAADAHKQESAAGQHVPVAAPSVGKGSSAAGKSAAPASSTAPAKTNKIEARGAAAPQRGRTGPRSGRGQHGRGAQGRGAQGGGRIPQPLSHGPTPPPGPNGMNMPRPGPGMPGLPMPPGMMLSGPMMGTRPMQMQMMPRPMPMAAGQPRPPPGRGPAPSIHSPDRQRGRHVPIPAPQPPPRREPAQFPQMGIPGGADRLSAPAVLPMPPMAHLMSQSSRLPHPQPPPSGPLGSRQDQRGHVAGHLMPNGVAVQPPPPATNRRGTANNFNLALGMDASSSVRNPQRNGALGGRPGAGGVNMPQRLQGRLEEPAPLPGLLRPRDMAEELRQKEERQEAERARAKAKEAEEKKKAEELKAKRLEMAKLQIALQQAENRKNQLLRAAAERSQKQRELEDFEAMKLRVLQLEKMVAAASAAPSKASEGPVSVPSASAPAAASEPQQKILEMGDPGLQVNFDDDETEEEPSPQGPPAMPLAMRLQRTSVTNKDVKVTPTSHSRAIRSTVRPVESEQPAKEKRRRRSPVAMETEAKEAAPVEGYTDLREFLSRKKRTREGGARHSGKGVTLKHACL
ncbi:g7466 [Coccomyxa elongata]